MRVSILKSFKSSYLLLAATVAISRVGADFWIASGVIGAGGSWVAIPQYQFTCSGVDAAEGNWPTFSGRGAPPDWLGFTVSSGLCGSTASYDMYWEWDLSSAQTYWSVYEHGGDGQNLGSCWVRGGEGVLCPNYQCQPGGTDTNDCPVATSQIYCYTALCGVPS